MRSGRRRAAWLRERQSICRQHRGQKGSAMVALRLVRKDRPGRRRSPFQPLRRRCDANTRGRTSDHWSVYSLRSISPHRSLAAVGGPSGIFGSAPDLSHKRPPCPNRRAGRFQPTCSSEAAAQGVFDGLTEIFSGNLSIVTAGVVDNEGEQAIDHIACTSDLDFSIVDLLPKTVADQRLSDHFGVVGELTEASA